MNEPETEEMQPTRPRPEHEWLRQLEGKWSVSTKIAMFDGSTIEGTGSSNVTSLGGLWAIEEVRSTYPDGSPSLGYMVLGYDVSFNEYRGCYYMDGSSHLWKYAGSLSDDKKTMTLDCEGPDMVEDGKTARYREVIDLLDDRTRRQTSYGQEKDGSWNEFCVTVFTRADEV